MNDRAEPPNPSDSAAVRPSAMSPAAGVSARSPDSVPARRTPPRMPRDGRASAVLAARGIVACELAQWPTGNAKELDLAVAGLASQGQRLRVPIEALIVELMVLVQRHVAERRPEPECRPMRDRLVSTLIAAYYRTER